MTKLTRHPKWRASLCAYLASVSRSRYRPGEHDCALFAAGAVQAMTGEDLAEEFRGQYQTLEAGYALLRERGFGGPIDLAAALFEEVEPLFAQVGDLAVVDGDDGDALGIVQGPSVYVLRLDGPGRVELTDIKRAFRV